MILVRAQDIDTIVSKNPNLKFKTVLPAKIGSIKNLALGTSLAFPLVKPTQPQALKFAEFLTQKENESKLFNAANRTTFVPYNQESLNEIEKESPFAIFSDISPTAELFKTPDYEATSKAITIFLTDSYKTNFSRLRAGETLSRFSANTVGFADTLNRTIIPTPSPTPTTVK